MNERLLKSRMIEHGDTQAILADSMGMSLSRLNAKIKLRDGAEFTNTEMTFIARRYGLRVEEIGEIFFNELVS